jgi:outer membrane beta-barrel protein
MEIGIRILLLTLMRVALPMVIGLPVLAAEETQQQPEQVIKPEIDRRKVKEPDIDTENFEIGPYVGILAIEDFGTNFLWGVRFDYHVTPAFFAEFQYGRSEAGTTSFENLAGDVELLTDEERQYSFYNLSVGYDLLPGESFIGRKAAFNSALYLIGGIGSTDFAGDDHVTFNFGVGYRILPLDWMALHLTARDHIFDIDILGSEKTTNNIELSGAVTFFF